MERWAYRNDVALLVESQAVDADLAVDAGVLVQEVLVDAVVDDDGTNGFLFSPFTVTPKVIVTRHLCRHSVSRSFTARYVEMMTNSIST